MASEKEIKHFTEKVRDGIGFIFSEDVRKYYEEYNGVKLEEEEVEEIEDKLKEMNLIRE